MKVPSLWTARSCRASIFNVKNAIFMSSRTRGSETAEDIVEKKAVREDGQIRGTGRNNAWGNDI